MGRKKSRKKSGCWLENSLLKEREKREGEGVYIWRAEGGGLGFGELNGMTRSGTDQTKITPRNDFLIFDVFNRKSRDICFFGILKNSRRYTRVARMVDRGMEVLNNKKTEHREVSTATRSGS